MSQQDNIELFEDITFHHLGIWNNTRKTIHKYIQEDNLTDLVIKIENEKFNCHKCIIQTHIPLLNEEILLKESAHLDSNNLNIIQIDLKNVMKPTIFKIILDYVYIGNLDIDESTASDLLEGSKVLQMIELQNLCTNFLSKKINECVNSTLDDVPNAEMLKCGKMESPFISSQEFKDPTYNMNFHKFYLADCKDAEPLLVVGDHSEKCVVIMKNKFVYVFGGLNKNHKVKMAWCFSMDDYEWNPMPLLEVARCGTAGCAYYNKIFIAGGLGGFQTELNSVEMYNIDTDCWKLVNPMHYSKVKAGMVACNDSLWCFGGVVNGEVSDKIESYDIEKDQWILHHNMPIKRAAMGITELNGCIVIAGGRNEYFMKTDTVHQFNPKTGMWTVLPSLQRARSNFSLYSYHGYLVAVGGDQFHVREHTIEIFKPNTKAWRVKNKYNNNALSEVCII